ncbi:MAG TPA: 23S rRNA (pseudouridine(1915)-N(3))-methyltransferase RlmH [Candidatus Sphingobacterium stercorigallinarum]|nr:23S rRNA (pseudouridine(1915)-N(3))-methyltransferase RlmH [Candidatus Sphingobacterium stercorigallinarum]
MRISLICIGKTDDKHIIQGIETYLKRLKHYISFQMISLPDIKNSKHLSQEQQKEKEGQLILKQVAPQDVVVLLDERGKELSSVAFAGELEKHMLASVSHLIYIVGGPYGFDEAVYQRANAKMSLSKLTFSHQMVRLFFVEQVYRAMTIIRGEPYHHA